MRSNLIIPSQTGCARVMPAAGQQPATASQISSSLYYRDKTASIIDRYGPGPRVHYHIGLFEDDRSARGGTADQIRAGIVQAQERLLDRAASIWEAGTAFAGDLLDIGCGLGGGAIYWAQHFPVQVTAVTDVVEHADIVRGFAAVAGVADRVRTLVTDVNDLVSAVPFGAAVAVESSCYMPRRRLFQRVATLLKPGGVFGIEDIFLVQPTWRMLFDTYWKTSIGTVQQYREAAVGAGLVLEQDLDVTADTSEFWRRSITWARARLAGSDVSPQDRERLTRSISWHRQFLHGWREGAYEARILRFRKL